MDRDCFLIPEHDPDDVAEKAGVRWLLQYAIDGGYRRAGIVVSGVE